MTARTTAKLELLVYPDLRLRQACLPVERVSADLAALAERMLALMVEAEGVGLAAPQVGRTVRMFVCNATGKPADNQVWINPRIVERGGTIESEEGCLSIPKVRVTVRRAAEVTLEAQDLSGKTVRRAASELLARVWQHEIDHLDGKLIIDRMSEADKIATRRQLRELERAAKPAPRPKRR
ncbi:MAG: peptide deformylase [Phycisphaerae bacterium]